MISTSDNYWFIKHFIEAKAANGHAVQRMPTNFLPPNANVVNYHDQYVFADLAMTAAHAYGHQQYDNIDRYFYPHNVSGDGVFPASDIPKTNRFVSRQAENKNDFINSQVIFYNIYEESGWHYGSHSNNEVFCLSDIYDTTSSVWEFYGNKFDGLKLKDGNFAFAAGYERATPNKAADYGFVENYPAEVYSRGMPLVNNMQVAIDFANMIEDDEFYYLGNIGVNVPIYGGTQARDITTLKKFYQRGNTFDITQILPVSRVDYYYSHYRNENYNRSTRESIGEGSTVPTTATIQLENGYSGITGEIRWYEGDQRWRFWHTNQAQVVYGTHQYEKFMILFNLRIALGFMLNGNYEYANYTLPVARRVDPYFIDRSDSQTDGFTIPIGQYQYPIRQLQNTSIIVYDQLCPFNNLNGISYSDLWNQIITWSQSMPNLPVEASVATIETLGDIFDSAERITDVYLTSFPEKTMTSFRMLHPAATNA